MSTYANITRRKRAQAEAIEAKERAEIANRAKSDFLARCTAGSS